jgi:hypothetical protein
MKIENKIPTVPFSEKQFLVTLSGLELATLKLITGQMATFSDTICKVSSDVYDTIHSAGIKGCANELLLETNTGIENIDIKAYVSEINILNKNYDY